MDFEGVLDFLAAFSASFASFSASVKIRFDFFFPEDAVLEPVDFFPEGGALESREDFLASSSVIDLVESLTTNLDPASTTARG